ncbi:unnamed protein product [Parajaminaea phylloscopi]
MTRFSLLGGLLVALAALDSVSAAIPAHLHPKRELFERRDHASKLAARQAKYPDALTIPDPSLLPAAWKKALSDAVAAGKIPNIPQSTLDASGNPSYPASAKASDIGSWTLSKYIGPNDVSQAPDGIWAVNFDDGPTSASPPLYKFLQDHNQPATHFMIGSNIVNFPNEFMQANATGGQLAVHTWSHKLQTSLSNEQVLGDLGWTMQIIYDRTGRIPNLWRPPQGDVDNRVRAIAEEVLGLHCVLWKADSNDWCLDDHFKTQCGADNAIGQSYNSVMHEIRNHLTGSKSPGVILLEHEMNKAPVQIFQDYYNEIKQNGWNPQAIGEFDKQVGWYANALNHTSPTTGQTAIVKADAVSVTSGSSAAASSTQGSSSSSSGSSRGASTLSGPAAAQSSSASKQGSTSGALTVAPAQYLGVAITAGAAFVAAIAL